MSNKTEINEQTFKKQAKKLLKEIKNIENIDNVLLSESQNILARIYNKKDYNDIQKSFVKKETKEINKNTPFNPIENEYYNLLNKLIISDKSILNLSVINGEPSITLCDCKFMIVNKKMDYTKRGMENIKISKESKLQDLMRYVFNSKSESKILNIRQPQYNSFLYNAINDNMSQKYKTFSPFEKQEKESIIYVYTIPEFESNSFQMFISKKHIFLLEDSIKNGY